jgi:circadian clock protein KaiC
LPPAGEEQGVSAVEFHGLATSVVHMEQAAPAYGEVRRHLRVIKARGVAIHGGFHDFSIRTGGLEVYPRLGPQNDLEYDDFRLVPSGVDVLDELLGGGLERGTTCLLIGSSGTGKSTLAALYAHAVARDGGTTAIFLFEERRETFLVRSKGLGIELQPHVDDGRISIRQLQTSEITPGEFAQRVREAAEGQHATLVVIDSLTGYFNAMGNSPMLVMQMHELLTFLSRRGVLTLLVVSQEGVMTIGVNPAVDVSYLSDSIIALRMFEAEGAFRRCLSVIKKRQGEHETTIRELIFRSGKVAVGAEPLRQYRNILSGSPEPVDVGQDRGYGGSKTGEPQEGRGE